MKKPITKRKVSISLDTKVYDFLEEKFENKSKYVEYLIYKDLKDCGLLKKDIIL
jgi:tRNA splicing endonuclease